MHLFYRQEGGLYPKHPPIIPVPAGESNVREDDEDGGDSFNEASTDLANNDMGSQVIFASLCHFWRIMHEVVTVYHGSQTAAGGESPSLLFAEFKFRELLAWADRLPKTLTRSQNNPDVVVIMQ